MKIIKVLFVFALVSMLTVSCKETKKEEVNDEAVEMTEESEIIVEGDGAEAAVSGYEDEAAMEEVEAVEGESMGMEELVVPMGVIADELADTPIIYPGCTGSVDEIRACNKESFIAYMKGELNQYMAKEVGFKKGKYKIGVVLHANKVGRVFSLRVTAPTKALQTEMERVINNTPHVIPATVAGEPVGVSVKFEVDFRVE